MADLDHDDQFAEAFDQREAERIMSDLEVTIARHLGSPDKGRLDALIASTRRDLDREQVRRLSGFDEEFRAKRRDETDAQWKARVAQGDLERVSRMGDLVPAEAYRHRDLGEALVMHVESYTLARTVRDRTTTSLERMLDNGTLTKDQVEAAEQIVAVLGLIERDVGVRGASLDAKVDCSGSAKGALIERLALVRLQVTYSLWRQRLPMPRRLVIDMLTASGSMKAAARSHRIDWPKARQRLGDGLDLWIEQRDKVWSQVDSEDVERVHRRVGGGVVT